MCGVCGCGKEDEPGVDAVAHVHEHLDAAGNLFRHSHGDGQGHQHAPHHEHGYAHAHPHPVEPDVIRPALGPAETGLEGARLVRVQRDLLGRNDTHAAVNRARLKLTGTFAVNLMSSPGSGKTTLLTQSLRALEGRVGCSVIEGDQQTSLDAERIRATGVQAIQVNTGRGCHLDASMVGRALDRLRAPKGILFIENVGNLVCPAAFDLGEHRRVIVVSVTEGEDKPLKYPDMFAVADLVLVNKIDLLPHLAFDVEQLERNVRRLTPKVKVLRVSATTGEGQGPWLDWLLEGARALA